MAGTSNGSLPEQALQRYRTTPARTDSVCSVCKRKLLRRWFVPRNDLSRLLCEVCLKKEIKRPPRSTRSAPSSFSPEIEFLGARMRGEGQCAKASGGPQSGERIAPLTCVVVRRGSKLVGIGRRNPKIPFRRSAEQVPASQKEPRAAVEASGIFDETISAYGQGPPTSKQLKHAPVQQTVRALDVQWGGAPKGGETGERQRGEPLSFVNVKEEVRVPLDNATGGHEGQGGMQHKNKGGHGGGSLAPVGKGPAHAGTRGGASSTLGGQRKKRWPRKPEKGSQKPAPKCSPRNVALAAAMAPGSGGKRCDACGVAGSKRWYDKSRGLCMCIQCNKKEQCRRGKEGGAGDAEQQTVARDGREATAEAGLGGKELQPVLAGKGKKRKRGRVAEAPCKKKNRAAAQRFPLGSIRLGKHLLSRRVAIWWPLDKKFFTGTVVDFMDKNGLHQVLYDDGAQETVNFSKERWKLLEREAEGASGGESKSGDKEAEKDGAFTAPGRKEPDGKHVTGGSGSVESAGGRGSYVYTVPQPHQARRKRQGDSVSPDVPEKRCRRKVDEQRGVPSTSGDSLRRKEQPGSVANGGMGCMASARPATPLEGLNLLTFVGEHWGLQLRDAGDDLRGFEGGGNEAAGSGGDGDKSGSDTETAVGTTASKAVVCLEAQADPEASFRSSMEVAEHPSCVSPGSPPSQQFQMRSTRNPVGEKLPVVKDASGRALPPVDPSEDACKPPAGNQAGGREPGTGEKNGALGIHPSESQKSGLLAGAATVEERATCGAVGASDHKQEKAAEVGTRGSRVGGSVAESEAKLDGLKKKLDSQERLDTSNLPPKGTPIDPWQREGGVKAKVLSIEGGAVDGSSPGSVPCEANESILREQDARHPKEGPAAGSLQVAQAGLLPLAERYGSLWTAYAQELPKQASEDGGPSGQRPWDGAGIASPRYAEPRGRLSDSAPRDSGADREFLAALLGALSVLIRAAGAVDEAIGADSETPLQCLERLQRMEMDRGRQKPEERKAAAD